MPVRAPPITYDGSNPHSVSTWEIIAVVVVLPWVPATAIPRRPSISEPSAALRCSTVSPRSRASASSGLSSRIADDATTVRASPSCSARCPT